MSQPTTFTICKNLIDLLASKIESINSLINENEEKETREYLSGVKNGLVMAQINIEKYWKEI